MNNQNLINNLKNRYAQFTKELPADDTFKFTKDDVTINENGIVIDGVPVDKKAQARFLSRMKVKNDFINLATKATSNDWAVITKNLKNELKDMPFYAKTRNTDAGSEIFAIVDFPVFENVAPLDNDKSIETICDELGKSQDAYKLFNADFDKKTNSIIIGLINESTMFDVFGEKSQDKWMSGVQFRFTKTNFQIRHLLERLSCSNGMTTKEECFVTSLNKKNFTHEEIAKVIENVFKDPYKEIYKKISKQASFLKTQEISINEFYNFSKPFFKEAKALGIIDDVKEIFDDSAFFKTYGVDIKETSNKWKSTAKTGINAYDFFNALTYTATHLFNDVNPNSAASLQLNTSNFFFKENFDLEEIAPNIDVQYSNSHVAFR